MKKALKIFFYNLLVFVSLIIILNFLAALYLDLSQLTNPTNNKKTSLKDNRANLPNYKNISWSETFFKEFHELKSEYRSYYGWRRLPYLGKTIHVNNQGIRLSTNNYSNAIDTLPLAIFLGGSTMWGTGVNDINTIPSLFAKKTNDKYQILNFGEAGYSAYQSYLFLQITTIREKLKPKLIVSYDGVNNTPVRINFFTHARERQIADKMRGSDSKPEHSSYLIRPLNDLVNSLKGEHKVNKFKKKNIPRFTDEQNKQAAIELLETWLLMKQESVKMGARFICILQPNAFVEDPDVANIKRNLEFSPYQNGYYYYSEVLQLLDSSRYCGLKANFINMTDAFDHTPNVYIDFCHVSPNGNERIVNLLVNNLKLK